MEINYLKLINFRNYTQFDINFSSEGALIYGKNGIGKTNLLEAIAYFAFGKSFQTSHDVDLINFSQKFFRISAKFNLFEKELYFECAVDKEQKKIKIDDIKIPRISELYKYIKVVYFSPDDLGFTAGAPVYRRFFFDQAISQYSFDYIELLRKYNRILKQRNALLKKKFGEKEKMVWDKQFVKYGVEIIKRRLNYLKEFIPVLSQHYFYISGEKENLQTKYIYSFPIDNNTNLENNFLTYLKKIEVQEIENQRSLAGPHLDDIKFDIETHPARRFASQGQKRSIAIAARLVQAGMISQKDKEAPILMFDDVLSELDKERTKKILKILKKNHQIFIVTPNHEIYKDLALPGINLEKIV